MAWLQITLETNAEEVDIISDALMEVGALSVTLKDAADEPVYEPALNTTPLWGNTQVVGLFDENADIHAVKQSLTRILAPIVLPKYSFELIEDQEWSRAWMEHFHPMQFGQRLWICPSWSEPPESDAINILLDPGLAFGTGTHPTTALCLEWLDQQDDLKQQTWIDYGCGSGILAIAAAKLGAEKIWCVDNDPQALIATEDNGGKNEVVTVLETCLPEHLPTFQADGLVANILANPLITLAETFARHVKPNAWVVLSGILKEQSQSVIESYQTHFTLHEIVERENWIRLVFQKR